MSSKTAALPGRKCSKETKCLRVKAQERLRRTDNNDQGSFVEITNQRFSLKYQTFRQLAAAFISGSGLQSVHVLNV